MPTIISPIIIAIHLVVSLIAMLFPRYVIDYD